MQGRKGSRSLTHTADGSCRVRPRNLSGRTTGKSRQTGRRDRVTAAAKRTLASPPARLRWRHGTARTQHGGHITENPQGHAPHGRVKRSRWRLPLSSVRGPAGKRRRFFPASVIISGFLPGHPPCCGFRSGLPGPPPAEHHGQTSGGAVHPVYAAHRRPAHWTGYVQYNR